MDVFRAHLFWSRTGMNTFPMALKGTVKLQTEGYRCTGEPKPRWKVEFSGRRNTLQGTILDAEEQDFTKVLPVAF